MEEIYFRNNDKVDCYKVKYNKSDKSLLEFIY